MGVAWGPVLLGAFVALVGVYLYAAAALAVHHRLARIAPPRTLAHALLLGAVVPACGCTALALARRAPERLRAPFLVAAYAASPLLVAAAWLLAGPLAALAVLALALVAGALSFLLPAGDAPPRARLADLLLPRDARPLRDAAPYLLSFGAPAMLVGALVGGASLARPAWAALAMLMLSFLVAAPVRDVAEDHGRAFAWRVRGAHATFSLAAAGAVLWGAA